MLLLATSAVKPDYRFHLLDRMPVCCSSLPHSVLFSLCRNCRPRSSKSIARFVFRGGAYESSAASATRLCVRQRLRKLVRNGRQFEHRPRAGAVLPSKFHRLCFSSTDPTRDRLVFFARCAAWFGDDCEQNGIRIIEGHGAWPCIPDDLCGVEKRTWILFENACMLRLPVPASLDARLRRQSSAASRVPKAEVHSRGRRIRNPRTKPPCRSRELRHCRRHSKQA